MKKLLAIIAMMVLCISVMAAKYVEVRPLGKFFIIENNTRIPIHYYNSNVAKVEIVGNMNDVRHVETRVINGKLFIEEIGPMRSCPIVRIYCPRIDRYDGTGDFIAKTSMSLLDAIFNLSGPARLELNHIDAHSLNINARGSGHVVIKDAKVAGQHHINNFGTGKVTFNGHTQETVVMNHNQGNVRGNVHTQQFNATNMGHGNINMRGEAQRVTTNKQGPGKAEFKRR